MRKDGSNGFQFDDLSVDLFADSADLLFFKSAEISKWTSGLFQSAVLRMGRACIHFSHAALRRGELHWRADAGKISPAEEKSAVYNSCGQSFALNILVCWRIC